MTGRRLGALAPVALVLGSLAGCGGTSQAQRTPTASAVPLVPGSKVVQQFRRCDQGANAFCALDLVVTNRRYNSSDLLARDESHLLRKRGWSLADGDTGLQSAANSPGHKLRLTYTTASGDLQQIVLGTIDRPWPITYALSNAMFDRAAAMSMRLEVGAS
ncbi:MAG: hypothetical protein JO262_03285 [Solirubrobacterales bacterium]|nr:hypothetical protein [Solirubrobacterales bacterium]MBV9941130.1 hypothetical protein [Solirubrobacterales bacterium]